MMAALTTVWKNVILFLPPVLDLLVRFPYFLCRLKEWDEMALLPRRGWLLQLLVDVFPLIPRTIICNNSFLTTEMIQPWPLLPGEAVARKGNGCDEI